MSLKLEDVTYTYSPGTAYEMHALEHINLEIPNGQFVGIIGHTGSGKSTLVQHLNGLIRPTAGRVLYNGEDIWKEGYPLRELRSHVGLVFQYPEHQLFETDVITDVCFGPKNQGLSPEECRKRAEEALDHVGFPKEMYEKSPFELSGGQKRRVAIAGVLAMNPDFLQLFIVSEDFLRCIVKRHMTVVHDNNPLYIFCNILHAVRYEHDRNAARLMQQCKLIEDFIASLRIKACSRLVKHQKIRVHGYAAGMYCS